MKATIVCLLFASIAMVWWIGATLLPLEETWNNADGVGDPFDATPLAAGSDPALAAEQGGPVTAVLVNQWDQPLGRLTVRAEPLPLRLEVLPTDRFDPPRGRKAGALPQPHDVRQVRRTEEAGLAEFEDLPYDGSWGVRVGRLKFETLGVPFDTLDPTHYEVTPITARRVRVVVPALPFRFQVQAGSNELAWFGIRPAFDGRCAARNEYLLALGRGGIGEFEVHVELSDHHHWRPEVHRVAVSPGAQSLVYVPRLLREAKLFIRHPRGEPRSVRVTVNRLRIEDVSTSFPDEAGWIRVHGVPFVPDATVEVENTRWISKDVWASTTFGTDPEAEEAMQLRDRPDVVPMYEDESYPIPRWAERPDVFGAQDDPRGTFRLIESDGGKSRAPLVELRVQRPDGKPAIGANVRLQGKNLIADSVGRVVFTDVPPGEHVVDILGAGPSWQARLSIEAVSRQIHHTRLPVPGTIDLQVVNRARNPLPYADVTVWQSSGLRWFDMKENEQRVDPYVGPDGRRRLHNVEPDAEIRLRVRYEGKERWLRTTVASGQVRSLRVDMDAPNKAALIADH